ncbi:hypothetical protein BDF19DRAFT_191663 [Syncephalis fuscata]|nr:hypothetical protein BDF19DRAFT_191663 [Syncephalis fuscata]
MPRQAEYAVHYPRCTSTYTRILTHGCERIIIGHIILTTVFMMSVVIIIILLIVYHLCILAIVPLLLFFCCFIASCFHLRWISIPVPISSLVRCCPFVYVDTVKGMSLKGDVMWW